MFKHNGELIKAIRLEAKLHQHALAKIIGISQGQLSKVETGEQEVGVHAWLKFCVASGVDPFWFTEKEGHRGLNRARKAVLK